MKTEELISRIQSSSLFSEAEATRWTERITQEGISEALMSELAVDTQRNVSEILSTLGITSEESKAYKKLMLDFYNELKGIAKDYQKGEKHIAQEDIDLSKEAASHEAKKNIEESRATLAGIVKP